MLGVPLEMVHGGLRVAAVYISGVLAGPDDDYVGDDDDDHDVHDVHDVHGQDNNLGSLWTSILKPGVFLSGASGGVYALITGRITNWTLFQMFLPYKMMMSKIFRSQNMCYPNVLFAEPNVF